MSAIVPTAVYTSGPAGEQRYAPKIVSNTDAPRATRLAVVVAAWSLVQHFYPYVETAGTDWARAFPRFLRAAAINTPAAFDTTMWQFAAALHDGHGAANRPHPDDRRPPVLLEEIEGKTVVTFASDDATAAGVLAGDIVLAVDGVPIARAVAIGESITSAATRRSVRRRALMPLLEDSIGTPVRLRLQSPSGSPREVTLRRTSKSNPPRVPASAAPIAEVDSGIFYIDMDRLTDSLFAAALPRLAQARGVIVDGRGYPGDDLDQDVVLAHMTDVPMPRTFRMPVITQPGSRVEVTLSDSRECACSSEMVLSSRVWALRP